MVLFGICSISFCSDCARESKTKQQASGNDGRNVWNSYVVGERERDRSISVFDEIGICSTFHAPSVDVYSTHVTVHQKFNMRCTLGERMFCWCTYMCASVCSINHCAHILLSYPRFFTLPSYLKDVANYYSSERLLTPIKMCCSVCYKMYLARYRVENSIYFIYVSSFEL